MFDITFLGTAAGVPGPDRGLPAVLVEHGRHRFLVDCGEGTQRQMMRCGMGLRRIDTVLLTHGHVDHLLGLGGLAATAALWRTTPAIRILAGAEALRTARTLLCGVIWPGGRPPIELDFVELQPGQVFAGRELTVTAFPVRHRAADCFGFRFDEPARRPMLTDRLEALGVPHGPQRAQLAAGTPVTLPDGRRVEPDDVLGPPRPGSSVSIVGDTESVDDLVPHVHGSDVLVIEATFVSADADKARARSHLTVADATRLAAAAEIGTLWLTHLSSRYQAATIEAEARELFPRSRAARDFDHVRVPAEP